MLRSRLIEFSSLISWKVIISQLVAFLVKLKLSNSRRGFVVLPVLKKLLLLVTTLLKLVQMKLSHTSSPVLPMHSLSLVFEIITESRVTGMLVKLFILGGSEFYSSPNFGDLGSPDFILLQVYNLSLAYFSSLVFLGLINRF